MIFELLNNAINKLAYLFQGLTEHSTHYPVKCLVITPPD